MRRTMMTKNQSGCSAVNRLLGANKLKHNGQKVPEAPNSSESLQCDAEIFTELPSDQDAVTLRTSERVNL